MNEKIIKKVVLQLGKKEIELSVDEAKKLHEALNELFEAKVVKEVVHHHDYPRWYWGTYTIPYTYVSPAAPAPEITPTPIWYTTGNGTQFSLSNDGALNCSLSNA